MMYESYNNIIELPSYKIQNASIRKYLLHVDKHKWADLFNEDDLRFLKHKKNVLYDLRDNKYGVILKIGSWDYPYLKHEYVISNKIKHVNFVKPYCYFEYEEDIINFLCKDEFDDKYNDVEVDTAITISPFYKSILHISLNVEIIKQIILSLYVAFFVYKIQLKCINIQNVYIEEKMKAYNLNYKLNRIYTLKSRQILKIDDFCCAELMDEYTNKAYKQLYTTIINVLQQLNNIALQNIIEFIQDFNANDENIVDPMKSIDYVLSQVDCLVFS